MEGRVSSPILIGRAEQMSALHRGFESAARGEARGILVGGEAGVGKSRLVAEFLSWVDQQGGRALLGGCLELAGSDLPYAPIIEALRPVARNDPSVVRDLGSSARELVRILPELEASVGDAGSDMAPTVDAQGRLFEAMLRLLERLSAQRPLVLAIEDAQWSDRSTRDFLAFLVQNLRDERMLLLITYRTDRRERDRAFERLLGQLEHSGRVERVLLEPLAQSELTELVQAITGTAQDARLVQDIYNRSEGNPLFAEELIAARSATPGSRLPRSLNDLLLTRVVGLSSEQPRWWLASLPLLAGAIYPTSSSEAPWDCPRPSSSRLFARPSAVGCWKWRRRMTPIAFATCCSARQWLESCSRASAGDCTLASRAHWRPLRYRQNSPGRCASPSWPGTGMRLETWPGHSPLPSRPGSRRCAWWPLPRVPSTTSARSGYGPSPMILPDWPGSTTPSCKRVRRRPSTWPASRRWLPS